MNEKPQKNNYDREAYEDDSPELNQMIGWDKACDDWEAYHNEILSKYIRKDSLPSVEEIAKEIELSWWFENDQWGKRIEKRDILAKAIKNLLEDSHE